MSARFYLPLVLLLVARLLYFREERARRALTPVEAATMAAVQVCALLACYRFSWVLFELMGSVGVIAGAGLLAESAWAGHPEEGSQDITGRLNVIRVLSFLLLLVAVGFWGPHQGMVPRTWIAGLSDYLQSHPLRTSSNSPASVRASGVFSLVSGTGVSGGNVPGLASRPWRNAAEFSILIRDSRKNSRSILISTIPTEGLQL